MTETNAIIQLDADQYRRWLVIAGRKSTTPEHLARDLIVRAIEKRQRGQINQVLPAPRGHADGPAAALLRAVRRSAAAGPTRRRKYCTDKCRVAAHRQLCIANPPLDVAELLSAISATRCPSRHVSQFAATGPSVLASAVR